MAIIPQAIDFEQVEDRKSFDVIEPQDVVIAMTANEYKQNKKQNGHGLNLQFQILEGEFAGRNLWSLLNLDNPNADTVRIAQAELKEILVATDMLGKFGDDVDVLHNIPMIATIIVEPPQYEKDANDNDTKTVKYKAKNKISKYAPVMPGYEKPAEAAKPQTTAAKPTPTGATPAANTGKPAFLNKKV